MKILVLNSGSSSLKYKLFSEGEAVADGIVEHIGEEGGVKDHREALEIAEKALIRAGAVESFDRLDAVGHRVVHGGERFIEPVRIDSEVIGAIRDLIPLAPLHNPANLEGIEMMKKKVPHVPQVAVFDTAFHQTMPKRSYLYAIPLEFYENYGVRRYGFHGTSHMYIAKKAAERLGKPLKTVNLITLHLGNGASACAIEKGQSVDTSMGFTPLAGLVMGTRSGDIDPEIPVMMEKKGLDADTVLNKQSGLRGLCGENDMRRIQERAAAGDEKSRTALEVYVHRIRHYIGAYMAQLGRVDALVFTAGIGEHSPLVRQMVCRGLEPLGIVLDTKKNADGRRDISAPKSQIRIFVIPTDEELEIALQTEAVLKR
ncbi:acetate/propionate family kinase [Hydrogenimonas urashimensis]|uniref:acetate/propionate family kinase n=1 Tax=Hydrogenimonas urashimensis TaxID=2740515 RepID=UPI0019164EFD|nr:acetate kinase [Hydrogenimonas urashimensis]